MPPTSARRWAFRLVRLALVALLLGWIITSGRLTVEGLLAAIAQPTFLVVVMCQVLVMALNLGRWVGLARASVPSLSWRRGWQVALRAHFTTLIVPAVGGSDALKIAMLREHDTAALAASCVADRAFALFGLGLALAVSMVGGVVMLGPDSKLMVLYPACLLFVGCIAFVPLGLRLANALLVGRTHRLLSAARQVSGGALAALRWSWKSVLFLTVSAISHLVVGASVAMAGPRADAPVAFVVTPLVTLSAVLPITPQGIGVSESVMEWLYGLAGVPGGATAFVAIRLAGLLGAVLAGGAWLLSARQESAPTN